MLHTIIFRLIKHSRLSEVRALVSELEGAQDKEPPQENTSGEVNGSVKSAVVIVK